jgi:hypothetical protein
MIEALRRCAWARNTSLCLAFFGAVLIATIAPAAKSSAAVPTSIGQVPEGGTTGSAAGLLDLPSGIAADPNTGHVYVAEYNNHRISEFTVWGEFVKTFGWGVRDGANEFQVCTEGCQKGLPGSGPGQFDHPTAVVVDDSGFVYVADWSNHRVQKFAADGTFELMFGGVVNATSGADRCTKEDIASGDVCAAGAEGNDPGEFGAWAIVSSIVAVAPSGKLLIGDDNRIDVFTNQGIFVEQVSFSGIAGLPEGTVKSLAVDSTNDVYVAFNQDYSFETPQIPNIYKLSGSTWEVIGKLLVDFPRNLELDNEDSLFVVAELRHPDRLETLEFNQGGDCLICVGDGFGLVDRSSEGNLRDVGITDACGSTNIFLSYFGNPGEGDKSYFSIYGSPPDSTICPPPPVPPTITGQFAAAAGTGSATLEAEINPHFWPDTTFYLEYGREDCAVSTCTQQPLPPGNSLGGQVTNSSVKSPGVVLTGLEPGTTYHYRFVAQSGGGGPTIGPDATFTTFQTSSSAADSCPNSSFRYGAGAALPDCRAYEMVSPLDKEGGDIMALKNVFGFPASMNQAALSGERLTYSSNRAFADPKAGAYTSQYLASRTASGWQTEGISPQRNGPILERGFTTDVEFKAFSPDLCLSWLRHDTDPPLAEGAPGGYANLYRRQGCGGGSYEALRTPAPPLAPTVNYEPELQGHSADGRTAIFVANDKLSDDAPVLKENRVNLYLSRDGEEPDYVCILPNETPDTGGCSAGTYNNGGGFGRSASVQGAISEDGSLVYWSNTVGNPGKIYLRVDGSETLPVSAQAEAQAKTSSSQFWAASADGQRAMITTGGRLYEVAPTDGENVLLATGVKGLMGVSEDAGDVYLVSEADLDSGGPALAGRPNLYHYEREGENRTTTFVMEVAATDARETTLQQIPSPVNVEPVKHSARVSADGDHLAFMSNLSPALGGSDNKDVASGKPDAQVYLYDADADQVHCVSCNATGARPAGEELEVGGFTTGLWAAGKIPTWQNQLQASRILSESGDRLFFESTDVLVPRDTNGKADVYEWELAGTGSCTASLPTYSPAAGGCVDLISSGKSPYPSEFVDADPTGEDAFFATLSGLVPQDYGLIDIYDAREGGGFAPPPAPPTPCEGAACQTPPPAPGAPSPSSSSFHGPGSPPQKARKKCPKGRRAVKRHGRTKCVKKKKAKAHKTRRTAR